MNVKQKMGLTLSDGTTPDSILPQAANFSVFSVFEKSAKEKDYNWNTIAADSRGKTSWIFCPSGSQWRNGACNRSILQEIQKEFKAQI